MQIERLLPHPTERTAQTRHFVQEQLRALFPTLADLDRRPDLLQLEATYLRPDRAALFTATGEAGELLGTIAVRPYDDRLAAVRGRYDLPVTAEVTRCYVRPDRRGQGVGRALAGHLDHFVQAAGFQTLCLHTHRHLPGGLPFWLRQGFTICAEQALAPDNSGLGVVYLERGVR